MTEVPLTESGEAQWRVVDEGWGRKAVEFATLCEPANVREYVTMHQRLGIGPDDRVLDVACGSGLALELAALRGASCAGLDASSRLIAVAKDRSPDADLRVGDMHDLPWDDGSFDVVTSFRGIWGTTPGALSEVLRVLKPGGRVGLTVWGHIKASPGAWVMSPFTMAPEAKVENQAAMVALGRPGAGEALLSEFGFRDVTRIDVPFVFEFADPEAYARALASTGPAFEAIQAVGEESFLASAIEVAQGQVREGLPLRASVLLVGYVARKGHRSDERDQRSAANDTNKASAGFLRAAEVTPEAQRLFDNDLGGTGYVTNSTRLWAHSPAALEQLSDLLGAVTVAGSLTLEQRSVLVTAAASALGDSYCSMAWGRKLADAVGPDVAAGVISGGVDGLGERERALAKWARLVATDANAIAADDVQALRDAGLEDSQIFAITAFVALRVAFSTVNDALGALPDHELGASLPDPVRSSVTFGRPVDEA
jgi:SAM-dependent methyltransferase/alkylhydroperoxidase family enzyme